MPRVLGVLGGMGPEATILFMSRILQATPAQDDADHIPLLVDSNTQIPSRIRHLIEGTGIDPTPTLLAMAQHLVAAGAKALAMPCNTAHSYYDRIAPAVPVPFFDMVTLTAAGVSRASSPGPIGILASPAVEKTGVFASAFSGHGRDVIYPDDRDAMLTAIRAIKAGREEEALPVLRAAAAELASHGAAAAVIGCSEFSLLASRIGDALPLTDSLDVLTKACVDFCLDPHQPSRETRP